ncbi:adenosylcobinamide-GDP ribazoletransferase [Mitsuokella sp.]|uniref:adenosylcobinamide-GDP ribazoletransferase n=1 Tax=unclassified Mitsuokella TaxID=2637239 RepID=UPI003D7DF3D0
MRSFLTALQFLTRIHLVNQKDLTTEDFGRSTKFFPLVGVVLGAIYLLAALLLFALFGLSGYFPKAVLVLLPILLTGGLHCDGFMDTIDGLFSGRSRERMLTIMKDSRTGSFGVVAFGVILLMDWALLLDLPVPVLLIAVFVMPIIGRMAMLFAVAYFPYARPEGMGRAFAEMADRKAVVIGFAATLLFTAPWGLAALAAMLGGLLWAFFFGRYACKKLGGLTGDVYGAVEMTTETAVLVIFYLFAFLPFDRSACFLWM